MSGRVYLNQVSTTVQPNKKCEGCLHYEPQRSKGGLCLVALQPWNCGEGDHHRTDKAQHSRHKKRF